MNNNEDVLVEKGSVEEAFVSAYKEINRIEVGGSIEVIVYEACENKYSSSPFPSKVVMKIPLFNGVADFVINGGFRSNHFGLVSSNIVGGKVLIEGNRPMVIFKMDKENIENIINSLSWALRVWK